MNSDHDEARLSFDTEELRFLLHQVEQALDGSREIGTDESVIAFLAELHRKITGALAGMTVAKNG